jgi:hypothetical protein
MIVRTRAGGVAGSAASRWAVGVELQGHGHTADTDRALTLDGLADDVAGLLDLLDIERADLNSPTTRPGPCRMIAVRTTGTR